MPARTRTRYNRGIRSKATHLRTIPESDVVVQKHGAENGYWDEIASLCIDDESLRIQKQLLKQAVSKDRFVKRNFASIDNAVVVLLAAEEDVNTISYLVKMLEE